jgi:hypothetical protein
MPSDTSLGGTRWLSRAMEVQRRFLVENRIDDSPRRKPLKLSILGLLFSTGATFIFFDESTGRSPKQRNTH